MYTPSLYYLSSHFAKGLALNYISYFSAKPLAKRKKNANISVLSIRFYQDFIQQTEDFRHIIANSIQGNFRTPIVAYDTTKDIKQAQIAAGHTTAAMTLKHYIKGRHQHINTASPIASAYGLEN